MSTFENTITPHNPDANLRNYDNLYKNFSWDDANKEFSWHRTGKINIGYEAIDRHAQNPVKAHTSCLTYSYGKRTEKITYQEMQLLSNKCGAMLR
jgi:acetyl-CoA synthetase